jgi:calcium/calmodulin-dependent protein kinase I
MENLSGGALPSYLKENSFALSEERASTIIHSLSGAMDYLHTSGFIVQSLNPADVKLIDGTNSSDVKIVDLGMNQLKVSSDKKLKSINCDVTICLENYAFQAPEQILGGKENKKVDSWGLGIVAFMSLCGGVPFEGANDNLTAR